MPKKTAKPMEIDWPSRTLGAMARSAVSVASRLSSKRTGGTIMVFNRRTCSCINGAGNFADDPLRYSSPFAVEQAPDVKFQTFLISLLHRMVSLLCNDRLR